MNGSGLTIVRLHALLLQMGILVLKGIFLNQSRIGRNQSLLKKLHLQNHHPSLALQWWLLPLLLRFEHRGRKVLTWTDWLRPRSVFRRITKKAQNAKKERKIQVMDIHEIPKPRNGFIARNKGNFHGRQNR